MISVTIIIKNGQKRLKEVLSALKGFDEIVLYDTGSTDNTLTLANQFKNVVIFQKPFIGFGPCHNEAAKLAKHDWILSLDADEVLSSALAKEIQDLELNSNYVYALPFRNYFNGKHIKWCGWYPEKHARLYHKQKTGFSELMVHEGVKTQGLNVLTLNHFVNHYSYDSLSDFLIKMERYSSLFAEQYQNKRRSSPLIALRHAFAAFIKSYFFKRGFLGGYEGWIISVYNAHTAFYKYLKLYQANKS